MVDTTVCNFVDSYIFFGQAVCIYCLKIFMSYQFEVKMKEKNKNSNSFGFNVSRDDLINFQLRRYVQYEFSWFIQVITELTNFFGILSFWLSILHWCRINLCWFFFLWNNFVLGLNLNVSFFRYKNPPDFVGFNFPPHICPPSFNIFHCEFNRDNFPIEIEFI